MQLDPKGLEAARQKGRELAGKQPDALVEAFAEIAVAGAAAYLAQCGDGDEPYRNSEPGKSWNEAYALAPANPVQVTDASEALDNLSPAESIGAFDGSGQWVEICTVADFRKLTAAIGAGSTERLGRFSHHPDPAIDFEIEVESLQARLIDAKAGISKPGTEPEEVSAVLEDIQRAMTFRVGGDPSAVRAKQMLREIEADAVSAIGAGGQAVQDTWFTDRALPVKAMSGDVEDNRVLRLHFRRPVTDDDRKAMCDALNLHQASLTHPAPSGQAVAVKALERLRDATSQSTNTVSADGAFAYVHAVAATALDALSNPPAQPGWRDMERDAERWNALLRCARIRMQGSSGFDPKTGERQEYNNATGETEPSNKGWVHFGAEFWSVYPGHEDEDKATRWGTLALIALADDVLLKERQSLPAAPQPKGDA